MRVITGTAKGRKLIAPNGVNTRPTSDMAKEAVFSIVQFELENAKVLDLFAGSGQLGIEALSRGAYSCSFVDNAKDSISAITQNLEETNFKATAKVFQSDAISFLRSTGEKFDIAFIDPPYNSNIFETLLPIVYACMSSSGAILCETQRDELLPDAAGEFRLKKEYRYGKAKITLYRKEEK